MELLTFILVSISIIILPGPNVLVVVSTSIVHGKLRGLQTVAGTSAAMAIQLCIAALGTSWLVHSLTTGFLWLKWLGVIYLFYLGANHLLNMRRATYSHISAMGTFQRGFWVSLTNPKTILFFSAFLPQFADPDSSYYVQIVMLSGLFWLLAVILDSCYALLAYKSSSLLNREGMAKYHHGASGVLYLTAATALATTKN